MYKILKTLIDKERYEIKSMQRKLDIYLLANKITEDEYKELLQIINQNASI